MIMNDLEKRIASTIARNPGKNNSSIAKNYKGVSAAFVAAVRLKMQPAPIHATNASPEDLPGSGIALRGRNVLSRRPVESAAKFIKRLPKGRGFTLAELSKNWGMSEETIRKHARDMGCLKFVEVSEDEWQALVLNPETAQSYSL